MSDPDDTPPPRRAFVCAICGGAAYMKATRGVERLMCPTCGPTHPARTSNPAPASPVPLSEVAPESTSAPAPRRALGPSATEAPLTRLAGPPVATGATPPPRIARPSIAPPPPEPAPPRRRDLAAYGALAGTAVFLLGIPMMGAVYDAVSGWIGDVSEPLALRGGWEQARYAPSAAPAEPAVADDPVAARLARLPPPEIPEDFAPEAPLTPGVLPGVAAPAPTSIASADDATEAVVEKVGALRSDRVVVRLHSSPPGAAVGVDGRARGRTPAKLMLNPGQYNIELTVDGVSAKVDVNAVEDKRLCFAKEGGQLSQVECTTVL